MQSDVLALLNAENAARRASILVTELATGAQRLILAADVAADPLAPVLKEHLRSLTSGMVEADGKNLFLLIKAPPVRLIAIGAVHISQTLAPIAKLAGFDVVIIDPRTAFASIDRFPEVTLISEWPQDVLPQLKLDAYTAVVHLTHEPRIDDQGLRAALAADCFYIGALGSQKTHLKRLQRLRAEGFDERSLARIHAPAGLDIGAVSTAEIAVAILGEVIAARRRKPLRLEKSA